jgi:hypothetical protein
MGHNLPWVKGLYHQKKLIVEFHTLLKGPKLNSHDPRPIMSPRTYIILLLELAKIDRKEEKRSIIQVK